MAFKSYKNKLVDFGIKRDSFKNDAGENVEYSQVVARIELDGDVEEILLSGQTAPKAKIVESLLKAGETVVKDKNLLDD